MRSEKSFKNSVFAVTSNVIIIIITFVSRTIFIKMLGIEYLGINGLFSNVLMMLSFVELGIGSAIAYSLYKPLAENDEEKIRALMYFYKNVYRIIGAIIFFAGSAMTPFLHLLINELPDVAGLHFIFILFVINTAVSYLFSYKRTIITADQKQYLVTIYQTIFAIVQNGIQIAILLITNSYILFLLVQISITVLQNYVISIKADQLYPFLNEKAEKLDADTLNIIKKNTRALLNHKIGSIVVSSTDNILISRFINLSAVGKYSNYVLIINAINGLLVQIFSAMTASVGNIGVTEKEDYLLSTFKRVFFFNFWIYGFCSIGIITLVNSFIELWVGEKMLLELPVVILIVLNFYLSGMRRTVLMYRDALGLYWYDRYKPIFEAVINLIFSVILVKKFGIIGIFLGTTISTITTSLWIEPYVLYKYGFREEKKYIYQYFLSLLRYTFVLIVVLLINIYTTNIISDYLFVNMHIVFIIKFIITVLLPNLLFLVLFSKTDEFKWLFSTLKRHIKVV